MDSADDDRERAMLAAYLRRAAAINIDAVINDQPRCPHCGQRVEPANDQA
jgi:hypothetical protein